MNFAVNNILSWVASFVLAFVVKCYDGWFVKPYFEHPEIPFVAYLGMVVIFRVLVSHFTAIEFIYATENATKIMDKLIPTTLTIIWTYLVTLLFGWILHFFI